MKKIIVLAIIISISAVASTKIMIDRKINQNKSAMTAPTSPPIVTNEPIITEPSVEIDEHKEEHKRIVLGKSTYKENPLVFEIIEDRANATTTQTPGVNILTGEEFTTTHEVVPEYLQMSGLKNKEIQAKINTWLKENNFSYKYQVIANFSNILAFNSDGYDGKHFTINLVDGKELSIDDYLYDKNDIKNVLYKYVVKGLYDSFAIGAYTEIAEENNMVLFAEQIDNWSLEIINKYDKNDFDFYFNKENLYLIFDDIDFQNPMHFENIKEDFPDEFLHYKPEESINSLKVRIPFYDIYPYVSIYYKYADTQGLYENEESAETKLIGLDGFEAINESFLSYSYDLEEQLEQAINGMGADEAKIRNDYSLWNQTYDDLLQKDKSVLAYYKLEYSMTNGPYTTKFYVTADKNLSDEEEQDILKSFLKAFDVTWDIFALDNLKVAGESLKAKYKDIDFFLETENVSRVGAWN